MKKNIIILIILVFVAPYLLTSCASTPSPSPRRKGFELKNADLKTVMWLYRSGYITKEQIQDYTNNLTKQEKIEFYKDQHRYTDLLREMEIEEAISKNKPLEFRNPQPDHWQGELVGDAESVRSLIARLNTAVNTKRGDINFAIKVHRADTSVYVGDDFLKTYTDQLEGFIKSISRKFKVYSRDDKILKMVLGGEIFKAYEKVDEEVIDNLAEIGIDHLVIGTVYAPNHIRVKIINTKTFEILFTGIFSKTLPSVANFPTVTIRSNVSYDMVTINGIEYGSTPLSVPLQPGEYVISVAKRGYKRAVQRISVSTNTERKTLWLNLLPEK